VLLAVDETKEADTVSDTEEEEGEENEKPKAFFRFIGEQESLHELFAEAVTCKHCKKGKGEVSFEPNGLATTVHIKCDVSFAQCSHCFISRI
jgi:hypothetical protein